MPDNNEPFGIRSQTKTKFKKITKQAREKLAKMKARLVSTLPKKEH